MADGYRDPRLSDEATGLPPLEELGTDDAMLVVAWAGGEGLVVSPLGNGEPMACRFLNVRGLAVGPSGHPSDVQWVQIHLAIPAEHAVDAAADWVGPIGG